MIEFYEANKGTRFLTQVSGKPKKPRSWWCQPCSQEVYSLRCKYCGKSEEEES